MEDLGHDVEFPSPPNSMYYVYGDSEQYLSESQSPNNSAYDATSAGDGGRYPSPGHEDGKSADLAGQQEPAAKRKRENRYKNASLAVLLRRRAQNRASQRAYRERKDQRVKDLEQLIDDAKQRNDVLIQAYAVLHADYMELKASQLNEQSYPRQYDVGPYGGGGGGSHAHMGLGAGDGVDGLEKDVFVYPDITTAAGRGNTF